MGNIKKIQIINGASIVPKPDWNQTDDTKADYIKNKPTTMESTENKITSLSVDVTDTEYPSAKAVRDYVNSALGDIKTLIDGV